MNNILATGTLHFTDPNTTPYETVPTIFKPIHTDSEWEIAFTLTTPFKWGRSFGFRDIPVRFYGCSRLSAPIFKI